MTRPTGRWIAGIVLAALVVCTAGRAPARADDAVRLVLDTTDYANLPFFLAADRGYFKAAHLDVAIQSVSGPSDAQLPRMRRGEVDVMPLAVGPGLFNAVAGGLKTQIVAARTGVHANWNDRSWLVVRQDLWDARTIVAAADMRGRAVDGGTPGSTRDLLAREALRGGELSTDTLTHDLRSAAQAATALQNRTVDVVAVDEAAASDLQARHLGHKWISLREAAPWVQDSYIAASEAFARDHHDALVRFLIAYLRGARDVVNSRGTWNAGLLAVTSKWTGIDKESLAHVPGPAWPGDGSFGLLSLSREQEFWRVLGLITTPLAITDIVDFSVLEDANAR